jgi:lysophospholipase L1-like esterase
MSPKVRSPRPKYPLKQIVIRFATAVIAALIFINIPHSLIPMFPESPSIASLPPEIENILAGKRRIVTIGDSITEAGKYPGGYVWLLQRYLNGLYPAARAIEIINVGISGNKATDMQARFQQDVIDKKPDLVMINVGVNDVWHAFFDFQNSQFHPQGNLSTGVGLAEYKQKLTQMVEAAKAAGIRVALLSPTPIREVLDGPENQRLQEYIIAMREIALQNQCLFIDLNKPFREVIGTFQRHAGKTLNLLAADGVHPNPSGYRIMAFSILRGLGIPTKDIENLEIKN